MRLIGIGFIGFGFLLFWAGRSATTVWEPITSAYATAQAPPEKQDQQQTTRPRLRKVA